MGFVNAICQYGNYNNSFDIYDAYHLMVIENYINKGKLYYKKVHVGCSPSPDSQIDQNNQKLSMLSYPYKAIFIPSTGRGAEDDGYFESKSKSTFLLRKSGKSEVEEEVFIGKLRLEVGTTESHTTYKHIFVDGGVARWPYNSNDIYLFYNPLPASLLLSREKDSIIKNHNTNNELREVLKLELEYTGQSDNVSLIHTLNRVNDCVEDNNIPTNLYTYTYSQLDVSIIDFYKFDLKEFSSRDELCIIGVQDKYDRKTNHIILRPNSFLVITVAKDRTSEYENGHTYLKVSFQVWSI
ncbi:hypothetical protein ACFSTH_02545 [Paenibacillus yanchengensis]|uniref:Uncharacterized protein n=1 Tax=Paenibacillus yanchengensis TaxID=2035833 RepID=A0ABW4YH25_9BACL